MPRKTKKPAPKRKGKADAMPPAEVRGKRRIPWAWLLLALLPAIGVAAFLFWPRSPGLDRFAPAETARLEVALWKNGALGRRMPAIWAATRLYAGQFDIPPLVAMGMGWKASRAVSVFRAARDTSEQEAAIEFLLPLFLELKAQTGAPFDAEVVAGLELKTWMLAGDPTRQRELVSAIAEKCALVHGHLPEQCLPAAKKFAVALRKARVGQWAGALDADQEGWTELKKTVTDVIE